MLLQDLKDAADKLKEIDIELQDLIGGGEWIISFHTNFTVMTFSAWLNTDNHSDDFDGHAELSQSEILSYGKYTEEQIKPLMDKIKLLSRQENQIGSYQSRDNNLPASLSIQAI